LAGKRLWRIDLGPNIREGQHYTQMSLYDFDGDGKAEVAVKTAPGTKDGTGAYMSMGPAASDDDSAVYRNTDGYILTGPEYLTVFDGATGKELSTVNYPVPRGTVGSWGDTYGNRVDRFNGGIAFVKDGGVATGRPSIIQQRGYYTRLTISALTWRNGTLAQNWIFDSNGAGNGAAAGGGDHSAMAADTNRDLGQEIITGATTIASNGTFQGSSGMGHGVAMDVSELVPGKLQPTSPHRVPHQPNMADPPKPDIYVK
jgi:rhamnogalacturonan endolyase